MKQQIPSNFEKTWKGSSAPQSTQMAAGMEVGYI